MRNGSMNPTYRLVPAQGIIDLVVEGEGRSSLFLCGSVKGVFCRLGLAAFKRGIAISPQRQQRLTGESPYPTPFFKEESA
jgi:hypothetical protein